MNKMINTKFMYTKTRHLNKVVVKGVPLTEILINHIHWALQDVEGWEAMKADLSGCDLHALDLQGVNLSYVNLQGTNLSFCNLRNANLFHADFTNANLNQSILINTNLAFAVFKNTELYYTDFTSATLESAHFADVDLFNCSFIRANLSDVGFYNVNAKADFSHANLERTASLNSDFDKTDLSFSNLNNTSIFSSTKLGEYRTGKILTESIIGYKACKDLSKMISTLTKRNPKWVIVKLEIPRGAIVFSINGNKCRTNKAKVLEIEGADRAFSYYDYTSYYVGDEFNIYNFNCQYNVKCAEGIHFFMTRKEAEKYINNVF